MSRGGHVFSPGSARASRALFGASPNSRLREVSVLLVTSHPGASMFAARRRKRHARRVRSPEKKIGRHGGPPSKRI